MRKVNKVSLGDKVFAKVKGYPAWPARVEEELGKKYKVFFYGTGETGLVKIEDLFPYLQYKDTFIKTLKRKDYNDAIEEIEAALKKDGHSINNESVVQTENKDKSAKRKLSSDIKSPGDGEPKAKKIMKNPPSEVKKIQKASSGNEKIKTNEVKSKMEEIETNPIEITKEKIEILEETVEKTPKVIKNKESVPKKGRKLTKKLPLDANENNSENKEEIPVINYTVVTPAQLEMRLGNPEKILNTEISTDQIQILLAHVEYGNYIAIKLGQNTPTDLTQPDLIAWHKADAKNSLELKEKLENGLISPSNHLETIIVNPKLTSNQLNDATELRIIERKKNKLKWLKIESSLVELDAMIKTSLGLDKADPKKALNDLDQMLKLDVDPLMLKKHPHVVDMIKRLKRYIGNVKEWKMVGKELEIFQEFAKEIREKADLVYSKFGKLFDCNDDKEFWEIFLKHVNQFRTLTADMSESQVFGLCAEPGSKQAKWDEMDEKEELKIIENKGLIKPKTIINNQNIRSLHIEKSEENNQNKVNSSNSDE